jgi:hypothetical protein
MIAAAQPSIALATDPTAAAIYEAHAAGLSVVPINRETKRPLTRLLAMKEDGSGPGWKMLQSRHATDEELRTWSRNPAFAIVCGTTSNGRVELDFDEERLYEPWRQRVGSLADGLPVLRTRRGFRVAMNCPVPGPNTELAYVADETADAGRKVGIETRGEGGYAVSAPSWHPDGVRYTVVSGDWFRPPTLSQAHAEALPDAARKLDECPMTRQESAELAKASERLPT